MVEFQLHCIHCIYMYSSNKDEQPNTDQAEAMDGARYTIPYCTCTYYCVN